MTLAKAVPLQAGIDLEKPFEAAPLLELHPLSIEFMNWDLARSGLVPEDISAYPSTPLAMKTIGTYVIPFPDKRMWKLRIDRRLVENGEKLHKYKAPSGITDIWYPHDAVLTSYREEDVLYIIEGEKKAAKFHKQWPTLSVIGIAGCYNATYTLDSGVRALLPNITACLRPGKGVVVVFDGDIEENYNIQHAAHSLADLLSLHQVQTFICKPPLGKGVDDWLVADPQGSIGDLVPIALQSLEMGRKQLFKTLQLTLNSEGNVILNEDNAARIVRHRYKDHVYIDRRLGLIVDGEVGNLDDLNAQAVTYIQRELIAHYRSGTIIAGIKIWLNELQRQPRDLVQEALRAMPWDGIKRLDTWGSQYFETDWPAWANEWGRLLFTGLGLRILEPGTKVDNVCILAGPQGIGKSTFFEDLGSFEDQTFYHPCVDISSTAGDSNRTQATSWGRALIVDLAEGVIFETSAKKSSMDKIKQIITQTHDEYREVYARGVRIDKRGFVFVGTTNRRDQHGDATGSRRFVNMWVTKIKRMTFADKMQILAEVRESEHQFRHTDWWNFRVTVDDAPDRLRDERGHIKNVQELVNSEFQRADADSEFIVNLIEGGEAAGLRGMPGALYLTAGYVAARLGNTDSRSKNSISRILAQLSTSNTFPYKLEAARKRLPQLEMNSQQELCYKAGVNNAQMMINGYIVTRK